MNKASRNSARTGSVSRRGFLKGAAVAAAAAQTLPVKAATGPIAAYVGAYTDRDGNALYIYDLNSNDGTLTRRTAIKDYPSPSSLALDPKNKFLYVVNEISNFSGTRNGSVTAFAIQPDGGLKFLIRRQLARRGTCPLEARSLREMGVRRQLRRRKHCRSAHKNGRVAGDAADVQSIPPA